jgi:oligoendopeptidase F
MSKVQRLPTRSQLRAEDTWDLSSLYADDRAWQRDFRKWTRQFPQYQTFAGRLSSGPEVLAQCLKLDSDLERLGERLGTYALLKTAEDQANSDYQAMFGRFQNAASQAAQAASFIRPEILAIPPQHWDQWLQAEALAPFRLIIERILRYRPHTLSAAEEKLLAMQSEMAQAAGHTFRQLLDTDLRFGFIENEKGEQVQLSNASFIQLLHSPKRSVRQKAFHQYYQQFESHRHTLAATLSGSVQKDVYYARARGFQDSLTAALFPDQVPRSVYENLIRSVHRKLPALHRYYELRRQKMRLRQIHHYDTYVPILSRLEKHHTWQQASQVVIEALAPLGDQYVEPIAQGLNGRWCDRYPSEGKQSGAFSCGSYDGDPYILMNYHPQVLNDVFTLAHEAGHSMHSYFSARHQPFEYYQYTIFVAEVASTFNEQLLSRYLLDRSQSKSERAYLINREIDDIRGTVFRQTMFAEFEKLTHEMVEAGEPLTIDALRSTYGELLERYFGPEFVIDPQLSLECLRIPHFYRAFYVYKYATGMSAAIALSQRVLRGGQAELDQYLGFLKSGCAKDPLDLLRDAGVDMTVPKPVQTALGHFEKLVDELEELL